MTDTPLAPKNPIIQNIQTPGDTETISINFLSDKPDIAIITKGAVTYEYRKMSDSFLANPFFQAVTIDVLIFIGLVLLFFFDRWLLYKTKFSLLKWIDKIKIYVKNPNQSINKLEENDYLTPDAISGEYTYTCTQYNYQHEHGGTCVISAEPLSHSHFKWSIRGYRKWEKSENSAPEYYQRAHPWSTTNAAIFNDNEFVFSYLINIESQSNTGFSQGTFQYNKTLKKVTHFDGHYFQRISQGHIIDGIIRFDRVDQAMQ